MVVEVYLVLAALGRHVHFVVPDVSLHPHLHHAHLHIQVAHQVVVAAALPHLLPHLLVVPVHTAGVCNLRLHAILVPRQVYLVLVGTLSLGIEGLVL